MIIRTCRRYKVAPDLCHLVEHEEQAEKPGDEHICSNIRQSGVSFRCNGQISALGAPKWSGTDANHQSSWDHRVKFWVKLSCHKRHVSQDRQRYRPFTTQPAATKTDGITSFYPCILLQLWPTFSEVSLQFSSLTFLLSSLSKFVHTFNERNLLNTFQCFIQLFQQFLMIIMAIKNLN